MRVAIWVAVQRRATSYSKGPAKHVDPARTDLNHSARAANAVGVTASAEVGLKPPGARSDEGSRAINPGDNGALTDTRGQPAGSGPGRAVLIAVVSCPARPRRGRHGRGLGPGRHSKPIVPCAAATPLRPPPRPRRTKAKATA